MAKAGDFLDVLIKSVNWKVGSFDMLPVAFGTVMAMMDIVMMGALKMVSNKTLPYSVGFPGATLLYAFQPFLFLKALTHADMTVVNLIWNLMSDIIVTLSGVFIFGESIKGLRWLAIGMSVFSLCLLAYTDE
jgi:multidrug transporter EmrE-like cation transporter